VKILDELVSVPSNIFPRMNTTSIKLPSGQYLLTRIAYTSQESLGVTFLLGVSTLSLVAVFGLLAVLSLSAFHTRSYNKDEHLFVRTHVAAYFISLLCCGLIQAIGSLYSTRWVYLGAVVLDQSCTTQGVLKQVADVGTALWTFIISVHTFFLLVLEVNPSRFTLFGTLVAGWSGIFMIVILGPTVLDTTRRGAFFGISGYWCWISDGYSIPRITLDYLFMFLAAFSCFIIHGLIHLRLRGNMTMEGWRMKFYKRALERPSGYLFEDKGMTIAGQMLLFPIAYSIMISPIAVARFAAWSGRTVPFEATVFCETVFLLAGCINVTLFCTCRQILPPESVTLLKRSISRPKPINFQPASDSTSMESDPYYAASATMTVGGYGFSNKYKQGDQDSESDVEKGTVSSRISRGSSNVSELTVTPPQIRRSWRRNRPPSVIVPIRRINSATGEVEEVYNDGDHLQARNGDLNDLHSINLHSGNIPRPPGL